MTENTGLIGSIIATVGLDSSKGVVIDVQTHPNEGISPETEKALRLFGFMTNALSAAVFGSTLSDELMVMVLDLVKRGRVSPAMQELFCRSMCQVGEGIAFVLGVESPAPPRGDKPAASESPDEYKIPPEIAEYLKKHFGEGYDA